MTRTKSASKTNTTPKPPTRPPAKRKPTPQAKAPEPPPATTKADLIVGLLKRAEGASLTELSEAASWQPHSVRGFLSGTLKRKRGLTVATERVDGVLRYRLSGEA